MPGKLVGVITGPDNSRRSDRWLNMMYAFPPERNIRDREDSPGARNPYHLWYNADIFGDETTGMCVTKIMVFDDDIRFGGTKAFSYAVQGQCLDSVGSPVAGATVELWQVEPMWIGQDQPRLIAMTLADANGLYGFAVPNTVTKYFVVAYVSSKGGVTVRNLVGA